MDVRIFLYDSEKQASSTFELSSDLGVPLQNIRLWKFLWYNIKTIVKGGPDIIVLMWDFSHISSWIILLFKRFMKSKIILWGQGISVKRYIKESSSPSVLLKAMLNLADGAWVYMENEADIWKDIFPHKPILGIDNTISGIESILESSYLDNKNEVKERYGIIEKKIGIYCARFNQYRRVDVMLDIIDSLKDSNIGFIIIGEGEGKPDFSNYNHVYDFGRVYDDVIKKKLFSASDFYFQPGWLGLSVVEALAYGLPVFSLSRSNTTLQCVELGYLNETNSVIREDGRALLKKIQSVSLEELERLGKGAHSTASKLSNANMVNNCMHVVDDVLKS